MNGHRTTQRIPLTARTSGQNGITLVELLISMVIMSIVTAMILVTWFALQGSFGYSVNASHAREAARDAVTLMTTTIRDSQRYDFGHGYVTAISFAQPLKIVFNTQYGQAGSANIGTAPVMTCLIFVPAASPTATGKIYMVKDSNGDGQLATELADVGHYGTVIVDNVMNAQLPSASNPTPLFTYTYFAADGTLKQATSLDASNIPYIYSVQIHMLVDLNPKKAPVYMDLQSTTQPRNMRPST